MGPSRAVFVASAIAVGAIASVGALQCGGQTVDHGNGGQDGGGNQDATSDHPIVTRPEASTDVSAEVGPSNDGTSPTDSGSAIQWPTDAGKFATCAVNDCDGGEFCVDYKPPAGVDAGSFAFCNPLPSTCEPDPTCFCIEEKTGCFDCSSEGGILNIVCTPPPHP